MRERRKPLNGISHSLTLQALTPALENQFPTFSTDCILAIVSRREREMNNESCSWDGTLAHYFTIE